MCTTFPTLLNIFVYGLLNLLIDNPLQGYYKGLADKFSLTQKWPLKPYHMCTLETLND